MENTETQTTTTDSAAGSTSATGSATLTAGLGGILGVKAGMTQIYAADGRSLAVTVVEIKKNTVTQVKKADKHGYSAVQVGFLPKKASRVNKAVQGHFKKSGTPGFYHAQEFRFKDDSAVDALSEGQALTAEFIKEGDLVDVSAVSKGKGFQGTMKKYHYHGGNKTHGASVNHRSIGSIGMRADPGKVFKGKPMPGHMGHINVSIQNLTVARVDLEKGIVLIHGSVPGPRSGIVTIRKAVKGVIF
jgi:large subunit ribosomal protein L3